MIENLLVSLIVLAAALYAAWRLWPARSRLALLRRLDRAEDPRSLVHRLRLRAEAASGCGACAAGTAATGPATPGAGKTGAATPKAKLTR